MRSCRPISFGALRYMKSVCRPTAAQYFRSSFVRERTSAAAGSSVRLETSQLLSVDGPIDEERLPTYHPAIFHQTHAGQVLNETYRTILKLGYGGGSTVWLAETLNWTDTSESPQHVAIKVGTRSGSSSASAERELGIVDKVAAATHDHPGAQFLRLPIDHFQIDSPDGSFPCLVYEPMRETLAQFKHRMPGGQLPILIVKLFSTFLLWALDYLHTECRIIHTDLKDDNILMSLENDRVLRDFIRAQSRRPLPRHVRDDGRVVYQSQTDLGHLQGHRLQPMLTDFNLAFPVLDGNGCHITPSVQPSKYRAPEVILGAGWSYHADVWNLGLLVWRLLEGRDLFENLRTETGHYDPEEHLAQMISVLGPPPKALLARYHRYQDVEFEKPMRNPHGKMCKSVCEYWGGPFFDLKGNFLRPDLVREGITLEDKMTRLQGEEKEMFLDFLRCTLRWLPEHRKTPKELEELPFIESLDRIE